MSDSETGPAADSEQSSSDGLNQLTSGVRSYENRAAGVFVSGFDPSSAEYKERHLQRVKRFGEVSTHESVITADTLKDLYSGLGIDAEAESSDVRLNVIHIRGVNEMSTGDVFQYFAQFAPTALEWIDDSSCNVVWCDKVSAARALLKLSRCTDDADFHQFIAVSSSATSESNDADVNSHSSTTATTTSAATSDTGTTGTSTSGTGTGTDNDGGEVDDDELNLLNEDDVAKLGLMTVTLQQQKDLSAAAAALPRQHSDDAAVAMEVDSEDEDVVDAEQRGGRQWKSSSQAATSLMTDDDKSVPWPSDDADVKRRWRVGRSCQHARWLFLRFASSSDVKKPGASYHSEYYRKYGNPNFSGMKGIISRSRRRKMTSRQHIDRAADDLAADNDQAAADNDRATAVDAAAGVSGDDVAAADHKDNDDDNDNSDEVVVKRRRRMRMYADDETPHQHATLRLGRASVWQRLSREDNSSHRDLRTRLDRKRR